MASSFFTVFLSEALESTQYMIMDLNKHKTHLAVEGETCICLLPAVTADFKERALRGVLVNK